MKQFVNEEFKIGGDGGKGQAIVGINEGMLAVQLALGFPVAKIVKPAVDLIKKWIPGEKYDKYAALAVEAVLKAAGVDPKDIDGLADGQGTESAPAAQAQGVEKDEGSATHENLKPQAVKPGL